MKFARYVETELATVSIMEEDVVLVVDNSFDDRLSLSVGTVCLDNIMISYYFLAIAIPVYLLNLYYLNIQKLQVTKSNLYMHLQRKMFRS